MKKQLKNRLAITLFSVAAAMSVQGQGTRSLRVEIPYDFTVGKKVMPAGTYHFARESATNALSIRSVSGTNRMSLPILTRLARDSSSSLAAKVVFDKAGDTHFLSEVWMSGEDGLLLRVSPKDHVHEVLEPVKK